MVDDTDIPTLIVNGFLVFCMQAGFIVYEVGSGRAKNVHNVAVKNFLSVLLCTLSWWAVGFAFAYGNSAGGVIGVSDFFTNGDGVASGKPWFTTFTFALSTNTIVSGCLAERTQLPTYAVTTVLLTMLLHPLAANWTWHPSSWLQTHISDCNFLDFAGGVAVHSVGGLVGLVGAIICGPRIGKFDDEGKPRDLAPHDMSLVSIGAFLMWFGWLGFNGGTIFLYSLNGVGMNRVAMNVMIAAASGGITALLIRDIKRGVIDLRTLLQGLLSGLVAATAVAGYVVPWAACLCGVLAGAFYTLTSNLLVRFRIDDPLESSAVHLGSGVLGALLLGLLAKPEYVEQLSGTECGGAFYRGPEPGAQIGMQFLGVVAVLPVPLILSVITFKLLHHFNLLRVDQVTELAGIDNMEHGGPAYPEFMSNPPLTTHSSAC